MPKIWKFLVGIIAIGAGFSSASGSEIDYGSNELELTQVEKIFPGARILPCPRGNSENFNRCINNKLSVGYLTWKLVLFVKYDDLDYLIRSGDIKFKAFAPLVSAETSPQKKSVQQFGQARASFMTSKEMSSCLRSECADFIQFSGLSHKEAATFWEKGTRFIECMESRNISLDPQVYDASPAIYYHLASQGKISSCPPSEYPAGLAQLIARIRPNRDF